MNTVNLHFLLMFPGFPVLRLAQKQNREAGKYCGTRRSRFSRFSRSVILGAMVERGAEGGVVEVETAPRFFTQVSVRVFTGPSWGICSRVMRTPIFLVWVVTEHSEQIYDFKYVCILKTNEFTLKFPICHYRPAAQLLISNVAAVIHLDFFLVIVFAPCEFLTGKTGKTGNALCHMGLQPPGFDFVQIYKPGNREKGLFFARNFTPADADFDAETAKKNEFLFRFSALILLDFWVDFPKTGNRISEQPGGSNCE